jgi:protein TonB
MNAVAPSPDLRTPLLVSLAVHIAFIGVMGLSVLQTVVSIPEPKILTIQLQPPLNTPQQTVLSTPPVKPDRIAAKTQTQPTPIEQEKTNKTLPILSTDAPHIANTVTVNQATITAATHDTPSSTTSNTEATLLTAPFSNQPSATTNEQAPIFDAAYLKNPQPSYPVFAKKRQQQGTVMLKVKVSTEGKAEVIELAESSGFSLLDDAAQKAVAKWQFIPARRGDVVIAASVIVPVHFAIN